MNDPYQYLEDLAHPNTQTLIQQAHAQTLATFCQTPTFHTQQQDILQQLQDQRQIAFCQEHQAKMYHFYQNSDYPKGVYRVCSAASYRAGIPNWQILFSVADFDTILNDDVYLDGVAHYIHQPERVLLTLSQAGSDQAYTLEFDLAKQRLVENGFHFPLGKNHITWRDEHSVWVCPAWDSRQRTQSGYPSQVWFMQRGQYFEQATPIYQTTPDNIMVHAWRYLDAQGSPIDLIESAHSFFQKNYYQITPTGETQHLKLPTDSEIVGYLAGQLLIQLKSPWQRSQQHYPAGSLIALKLNKGKLGEAQLLFTPNEKQVIESIETTKKFIIAHILDNVSGSLKAWKWQKHHWQPQTLPKLPQGTLEITDQPWGGDTLYFTASDFLTPLTLYALDLNVMELVVLRRQPPQFSTRDIQIEQRTAHSADGTAIPYYHVGKHKTPHTPTLVYVYGGFDVPELPHYMSTIGKHWLKQGGAFVLANVRGGGEFIGWHEAAMRENKHKSVDDLLAVLDDLCQRNLTSPKHIAIQGGSNGGLIVASAFCRQPEKMGALVCEVPLTDMLRYTELYAGASWIDEYGDPQNPSMKNYLSQLSPYHQINPNTTYPPALITTNLADDRVHPAHALKFYARLKQNPKNPCWLYAPATGGHTGKQTQHNTATELACLLSFLEQTIVSPNNQLKQTT